MPIKDKISICSLSAEIKTYSPFIVFDNSNKINLVVYLMLRKSIDELNPYRKVSSFTLYNEDIFYIETFIIFVYWEALNRRGFYVRAWKFDV
jgi:hypothetical protein